MGWTSTHRPKGITNEEFFGNMLGSGYTIHASGTVNMVFYAAVEWHEEPGKVWAFVALTHWTRADYFNFTYKEMEETAGPYHAQAPLKVLDALTPTDHPSALEWRESVRMHHAQRAAMRGLKDGDRIVLGSALRFMDGSEIDTFTVSRRPVRGGATKVRLVHGYSGYLVPRWQDGTVAVIRDGARVLTPLGASAEERAYVSALASLEWDLRQSDEFKARYGHDGRYAARMEFRAGDLNPLVIARMEERAARQAAQAAEVAA